MPRVIAVIGCDGSGKSTLTDDLIKHLSDREPVEWLYLGQSSGYIAERIKNLPIIGPPFGRFLVRKAERVNTRDDTPPGTATTIVIYLLSRWRAHKFRRMLSMTRHGVLVITDRYPQAEVPGFKFDGTGLGAINTESWLARKLAAREQKLYEWMAGHVPALVIRLNIDADTAHARKPDHKLSTLRDKVAVIPKLHFNDANILDLDGRDPYEQVLDSALHAIDTVIKTGPS
ncbi:MAG TPA: hypothetical protein ENJ87_11905 [Gammaproteobacteria bacterium]|nr:hypothetical protein [Gammaproteobacteria bacterium]